MAGRGIISLVSHSDPIRRSSSLQPRGPTSGAASRNRHEHFVNVTVSQRRRHRNGLVTPRTAAAQMAHLGSRSAIRAGARFPLTPQGCAGGIVKGHACPGESVPASVTAGSLRVSVHGRAPIPYRHHWHSSRGDDNPGNTRLCSHRRRPSSKYAPVVTPETEPTGSNSANLRRL